jgi:hypothetical protein
VCVRRTVFVRERRSVFVRWFVRWFVRERSVRLRGGDVTPVPPRVFDRPRTVVGPRSCGAVLIVLLRRVRVRVVRSPDTFFRLVRVRFVVVRVRCRVVFERSLLGELAPRWA